MGVQTWTKEVGKGTGLGFKPLSPFDLIKKVRLVLDSEIQKEAESGFPAKNIPDVAP